MKILYFIPELRLIFAKKLSAKTSFFQSVNEYLYIIHTMS